MSTARNTVTVVRVGLRSKLGRDARGATTVWAATLLMDHSRKKGGRGTEQPMTGTFQFCDRPEWTAPRHLSERPAISVTTRASPCKALISHKAVIP